MRYVLLILMVLILGSCDDRCEAPAAPVKEKVAIVKQETVAVNPTQLNCLAKAIYHEARGEEFDGQVAVANVVMNRTKSARYPDTPCQVVYQAKQFTDIEHCKPKFGSAEWKKAKEIAYLVYTKQIGDVTKGAMWYYAHHKIKMPKWASKKRVTIVIDGHTFLTTKNSS